MTPEEFQKDVRIALSNIASSDGRMLTKFVLIAEAIENDGDRAVWFSTSEGIKIWESLGLLDFASTVERGRVATLDSEEEL